MPDGLLKRLSAWISNSETLIPSSLLSIGVTCCPPDPLKDTAALQPFFLAVILGASLGMSLAVSYTYYYVLFPLLLS